MDVELPEVRVVRVQPGDVLAIVTPERISMQEAHERCMELRAMWPDNEVVVISQADLRVLRQEAGDGDG